MVWSIRPHQVAPQTAQQLVDTLIQIWEKMPQDLAGRFVKHALKGNFYLDEKTWHPTVKTLDIALLISVQISNFT